MKGKPIKRYNKEDIFKGALNSAEIEGIFFNEEERNKLWQAFKEGAKTIL